MVGGKYGVKLGKYEQICNKPKFMFWNQVGRKSNGMVEEKGKQRSRSEKS